MSEKSICPVCPRHCALSGGQTGFCHARIAKQGEVICANYGRLTALALDPIEKKPLARFHPDSMILSAGSYGCNMRCAFCQNHDISQADAKDLPWRIISPQELVDRALALRPQGNIGLAFTYNEPSVSYEYVRDASRLAHKQGLKNAMVTNGYVCEDPLEELLKYLDALNIDLKCFSTSGYTSLGGDLETVKHTIARAHQTAHVEITTLVVPGLSDKEEDMEQEAAWIASLSPEIPLHLSRYFPRWKYNEPATEVEALHKLAEIARKYLKYVYLGNC